MKAHPFDADTLRKVELPDLTSYLQSRGWQRARAGYRYAELWYREGDAESGIVVPLTNDVVDYVARMAQALSTLSRVESRAEHHILTDVQNALADVIRVRRPTSTSKAATIRLSEGVALVESAMAMVTSVACAALFPRRVIPSRRPAQASTYLGRVQLGQTEVGSYVLTIVSRIEHIGDAKIPSLFPDLEEPFPRRVTNTLASALNAVQNAAAHVRRTGEYEAFDEGVALGVSANLCEAIASMVSSPHHESEVGISVSWASVGEGVRQSDANFTFLTEQSDILSYAASRFRAAEPLVDALITGLVVDLHRAEGEIDGRVSVQAFINGKPHKLRVALNGPEYQRAIEAHRDKAPVLFKAEIEHIGRGLTATNVREFRVLG